MKALLNDACLLGFLESDADLNRILPVVQRVLEQGMLGTHISALGTKSKTNTHSDFPSALPIYNQPFISILRRTKLPRTFTFGRCTIMVFFTV